MLEISIDPGVCRCGLTGFRDGRPVASSLVRFIAGFENYKKFSAKLGSQKHLALVRAVRKFCDEHEDWSVWFKEADRLILETTSLTSMAPIFYGFVSWWAQHKPTSPLTFVDPRTVSRWSKFGPITRTQRKNEISKRVRALYSDLNEDLSQDEIDSIFNWIFYSSTSKTPRQKNRPCPELSWSSTFSRTLPPPKTISRSRRF